jgi:hypothetical protein
VVKSARLSEPKCDVTQSHFAHGRRQPAHAPRRGQRTRRRGSGRIGGGGVAQAVQKAGFGGRCTKAGPNLAAWRTWSFGLELDEAHVPRAADL